MRLLRRKVVSAERDRDIKNRWLCTLRCGHRIASQPAARGPRAGEAPDWVYCRVCSRAAENAA